MSLIPSGVSGSLYFNGDFMNKILLGLPIGGSVSWEFFKSFLSCINLMPEEGTITIECTKWQNIVKARNNIVKRLLKEDFTHLFFMDSDMSFPENVLSRLLQHNVDIVGGLYCVKIPPFNTTAFVESNGKGSNWQTLMPKPGDGLVKVHGIGTGCLLIRRTVLENLDYPYFWYEISPDDPNDMMTEDVSFCIKAVKAGFSVFCDTSIMCGHVGNATVDPEFLGDDLKVRVNMV